MIDDEPQIRRFLDISLRAQGYGVALADSGRAGLAELAALMPGAVMADGFLDGRPGDSAIG